MREKLKEKIESAEALLEVTGTNRVRLVSTPFGSVYAPWWLERELLRIDHEIYRTTEFLNWLNMNKPGLAVHVSPSDPTLVAYTPDQEAGKRDKQIKISLGRLLVRCYPYLPDETIQAKVAEHMGDLSEEVEFIEGEEIAKAYNTGLSTCMSNKSWQTKKSPLLAYDAPGIKMAVLRDAAGAINARAMVYEASEDDKRVIRYYGDQKLKRRLNNRGYKVGTWAGAKFRTIPVPSMPGHYIMPYLDGNGGPGSSESSAIALIDGVITSVSWKQANKLNSIQAEAYKICTNTSGYIGLENIDSTSFRRKCYVTGEEVNCLTDDYDYLMLADGTTVPVTVLPEVTKSVKVLEASGRYSDVYAVPELPTFEHRFNNYRDTEEVRKKLGYLKLDSTYYPDKLVWIGIYDYHTDYFTGQAILKEDSIKIINDLGIQNYAHKSTIKPEWIKVHSPIRSETLWAICPEKVVKTTTGRKVVPGYHEVAKTWDGFWAFTRVLRHTRCYGKTIYWQKGFPMPDTGQFGQIAQEYMRNRIEEADGLDWYDKVMNSVGETLYTRVTVAGQTFRLYDRDSLRPPIPYWKIWEAILNLDHYDLRGWDRALKHLLAECEAIEYPNRLEPLSQPVVETQELELV